MIKLQCMIEDRQQDTGDGCRVAKHIHAMALLPWTLPAISHLNVEVEAGRGRVSIRLAFQCYIITFPNGSRREDL